MKTYNQPITELLSVEPNTGVLAYGSPFSGETQSIPGMEEQGPGGGAS